MKTTLAILVCIMLPLVPQMVIYWFEKNEPKDDEYEHTYY